MFTLSLILLLQIGLKGEELDLRGGHSSQWISKSTLPKKQPLIWYKVNRCFCIKHWLANKIISCSTKDSGTMC